MDWEYGELTVEGYNERKEGEGGAQFTRREFRVYKTPKANRVANATSEGASDASSV